MKVSEEGGGQIALPERGDYHYDVLARVLGLERREKN
jgi:hypothetical protein